MMRLPSNRRGFTLVEMMIGLFILGVVGALAYKMLVRSQSTYQVHRDLVEATQNARMTMETVTSDIRQISYNKDVTQASILYAGIDSITFAADMYDSVSGAEVVSVYLSTYLDSTTQNPGDRLVYRSVSDTAGVILEEGPVAYGVADSGLTFLYFDRDGAAMPFPIVQPEHIAEIEVAVTSQSAHYEQLHGYRNVTVTSIVYPRNLPFTPPMARPSSPSCSNLASPNCESLSISWSRPTTNTDGSELKFNDISHYSVYYGTKLDSMNMDTRLARNVEDWTVANLVAGTSYYIMVTVTSQAGVESQACQRQGTVGASAAPMKPSGVSGVGSPSGITLGWNPVNLDTLGAIITAQVTYTVYRGTYPGFPMDATTEVINSLADTSFFDPVIGSCGTYYYRLTAKACGLESSPSTELSVSTVPKPSCPSAITAVEGASTGEIIVSWSPPSTRIDGSPITTGEIDGFRVYYSLSPGGGYTDSVYVYGGTANSASLTGLLFCETYYTNVAAVDSCFNRGTLCVGFEAAARTKAPCNAMPPTEVTNLTILGGPERVDLTWKPNTFDCDLDGYRIYYGTYPGDYYGSGANEGLSPVYVDAAAVQVDTSLAQFSLTGLSPCVEYYVTIVSVDNCAPPNESTYPAQVSDMVQCSTCDITKGCATESVRGSSEEVVAFEIANNDGVDNTISDLELDWGSGSRLIRVTVDGAPVWESDGSSGQGPTGAQLSPVKIDVDDYDIFFDEDFGNPVAMTLEFDGSANGDVIDMEMTTLGGTCQITLSPCGAMFSDNFSSTGNPPPGWTPRTGAWTAGGGRLQAFNNGRITPNAFAFSNTDYTVEARVSVTGSNSGRRGGIYVRYQDTGNYYLVRYYPNNGRIQLRRKVGYGSLVQLGQTYSMGMTGSTWYKIRVSAYGNQFRVWVDDQLVNWDGIGPVITDSSLPSGTIAMYAWKQADAYFDDVLVEPTCGCGGVVP